MIDSSPSGSCECGYEVCVRITELAANSGELKIFATPMFADATTSPTEKESAKMHRKELSSQIMM